MLDEGQRLSFKGHHEEAVRLARLRAIGADGVLRVLCWVRMKRDYKGHLLYLHGIRRINERHTYIKAEKPASDKGVIGRENCHDRQLRVTNHIQ